MPTNKHIVIVAGEESGDMHAACFAKDILQVSPETRLTGIGGSHMQKAGVELVANNAYFGVTGLTAIFGHIKDIVQAANAIKTHIKQTKPDLVVLVDCPGFNLRLAKFAKQHNVRVLYYISPQIWAWKANRIHHIKRYVDRMAVIFPFEKTLYDKAGVPVSFVGHPLVKSIIERDQDFPSRSDLGLPSDKKILALLPGSRRNEINLHMPTLLETASKLLENNPDLHFAIPIAKSTPTELIKKYTGMTNLPISIFKGKALEICHCTDFCFICRK